VPIVVTLGSPLCDLFASQGKLGFSDADLFMPGPMGGGGGAPVAAAAPEAAPAAAPVAAKTHFDVKLKAFNAANKLKVIKEVRAITNLGLKEVCALASPRLASPRLASRGRCRMLPCLCSVFLTLHVLWGCHRVVQAKDLVEGAPAVLMKAVKKEDTEAIIAKLKEAGAEVELE
jgi:large subunit ribosomal protein L7/L12